MKGLHTRKQRIKAGLVAICGLVFLTNAFMISGGGLAVFAQSNPQILADASSNDVGSSEKLVTYVKTLESGVQIIYLVMRPALALAGASLDNSLVYGEAFFLDRSLWRFWQLMRTFANYVLGFLFIGSILVAFFKQNSDEKRVSKLFKRLLLAGVLINMSRWLVASLIDFSTIATTAFGALPLQIMSGTKAREDIRVLKSHGLVDFAKNDDALASTMDRSTVYSCALSERESFYIACPINNGQLFEIGGTETEAMTLRNEIKQYEQARAGKEMRLGNGNLSAVDSDTISKTFCVYGNTLIQYEESANIFEQAKFETLKEAGTTQMLADNCASMTDLIEGAAGSTGPLYALYGSIFHMATISQTSNFGNISEIIVEVLMKIVVGLALVIPLLVLAVVLIVRVVVLWLVIAFSPILVLAYAFEFKKIDEVQGGNLKLSSLIGLIFLPVFAVFAVSISIVFLSVLGNIDMIEKKNGLAETAKEQEDGGYNDALTILGDVMRVNSSSGNENEKCYEFMGITAICISDSTRKTGGDIVNVLVWTVINFFGIALMWTTIFFVLKANQITGGIAKNLEGLALKGMSSIKFIPMGGGEYTGLGAANLASKGMKKELQNIHQRQYDGGFAGMFDGTGDSKKAAKEKTEKLASEPSTIMSFQAGAGTGPSAYDGAASSIVKHVNSTGTFNVNKNIDSMEGLLKDKGFARYGLTQDGKVYRNLLANIDKSGKKGTQITYSRAYAQSLRELADDGGVNGDHEKLHPDAMQPLELIWTEGNLLVLPWQKLDATGPGKNKEWLHYDKIDQYELPLGELTTNGHITEYVRLKDDLKKLGEDTTPEIVQKRYWLGGDGLQQKLQRAVDKIPLDQIPLDQRQKTMEVTLEGGVKATAVLNKGNGTVIDITK